MNTLYMHHTNTHILPLYLVCLKEPFLVAPYLKTYSITGWRLGYCTAPENIIEQIKKVHDFLTVGAAAPLQEAAVVGLEFSDAYYDELQKLYTHKKDLFLNGLKELNIPHTEPQGAYYVMVDISEFGYDSDLDFCVDLIKNVGVAAVPGSSFFKEKENRYIRFHFAKKDETFICRIKSIKRYAYKNAL